MNFWIMSFSLLPHLYICMSDLYFSHVNAVNAEGIINRFQFLL